MFNVRTIGNKSGTNLSVPHFGLRKSGFHLIATPPSALVFPTLILYQNKSREPLTPTQIYNVRKRTQYSRPVIAIRSIKGLELRSSAQINIILFAISLLLYEAFRDYKISTKT